MIISQQKNRHLLTMVALLYVAHALPLYFFNVALPAILRHQGVDIRVIGMLSLLYLPWAFKFLWASYVDNYYCAKIGKRKTWLFFTQIIVVVGLFGLGFLQFSESEIVLFLSISFLVSLASATQDIAIDGYTVEQFDKSSFGLASAMQSFGVAFGSMVGGAGTLWLYQRFDWQMATISLATTVVLISCSLWFLKDQDNPKHATNLSRASLIRLIKRPQTKWLLALIVVFRFVEAPMMAMLNPMLVDFGFSLSQIGLLFSVFGAIVGIGSAL